MPAFVRLFTNLGLSNGGDIDGNHPYPIGVHHLEIMSLVRLRLRGCGTTLVPPLHHYIANEGGKVFSTVVVVILYRDLPFLDFSFLTFLL